MTLVSSVTVGAGGAASIDFTSIPQTGTDLVLKYSLRGTYSGVSAVGVGFRLNGDSGANYSKKNLRATTSLVQSFSTSGGTTTDPGFAPGPTATSNTFSNSEIYIPNYTSTTTKIISADATQENNTTTQYDWFLMLMAGSYSTSSPITSLKLYSTYGDNWAQGSTVSLYTITKGSGGATVS